MRCKVCKKGELFYLFGFGLAITGFNYLSFGCIELTKNGAMGMLVAGILVMIFGAYLKSAR